MLLCCEKFCNDSLHPQRGNEGLHDRDSATGGSVVRAACDISSLVTVLPL